MPNSPTSIICDGKVITEITNGTAGTWTTNVGTLWLNAGATTPYDNSSVTQIWFKAQNKTSTGTVVRAGVDTTTVTITGVLPLVPNWGFEIEPDKLGVITNVKRDGSVNGRILGNGNLVRNYRLGFQNRLRSAYQEYETFFKDHYPHLTWKYYDLWLEINGIFRFPKPFKATPVSLNNVNIEQDIEQVI